MGEIIAGFITRSRAQPGRDIYSSALNGLFFDCLFCSNLPDKVYFL